MLALASFFACSEAPAGRDPDVSDAVCVEEPAEVPECEVTGPVCAPDSIDRTADDTPWEVRHAETAAVDSLDNDTLGFRISLETDANLEGVPVAERGATVVSARAWLEDVTIEAPVDFLDATLAPRDVEVIAFEPSADRLRVVLEAEGFVITSEEQIQARDPQCRTDDVMGLCRCLWFVPVPVRLEVEGPIVW